MPPTIPLATVQRALFERLATDATLVALLAASPSGGPGISDQPQPNAAFPRLELGGFFAVPAHRMGPRTGPKYGWEISGQVKVLSTYPGNAQAYAILARVTALLVEPDPPLVVTGFPDVACVVADVGPEYPEAVGNVIVRHLPAIVRVSVHES